MVLIFLFSLLLIAACFLTAYFGEKWNLKAYLAFSSGILLSLCILDFIPHSFSAHHSSSEASGFHHLMSPSFFILAGILLQALADIYLLPHLSFLDSFLKVESQVKHQHSHTFSPFSVCSTAGCLSICSFFDGIRLWTAFHVENFIAFSMAFGLFVHLLSEGVLIAGLAISSGFKKRMLFAVIGILGGAFMIGAFTAQIFSDSFSFNSAIAFSSGCLIYICFVHLLPVSLKSSRRLWFFLGVFLFSILHLFFLA